MFTTFSYAMRDAGDLPRKSPNFKLIDINGKSLNFSDFSGKYILVDFMYLHCPYICGLLRSRLENYYDDLEKFIPQQLIFLSISFDPQKDDPPVLFDAWKATGAKSGWYFTTFDLSRQDLTGHLDFLSKFGIIAIRNFKGEFNHTAYHYLINPKGEIISIIDPVIAKDKILKKIQRHLL